MQTSIIINTTSPSGKALQKTLTDVNASCSSAVLKTFSTMLNGLTQNTYVKTNRVDKLTVDTEESGGGTSKTEPTLSVGTFSKAETGHEQYLFSFSAPITYNGDGTLCVSQPYLGEAVDPRSPIDTVMQILTGLSGNKILKVYMAEDHDVFDGILYATEGASYAAKSITYSYEYEEG